MTHRNAPTGGSSTDTGAGHVYAPVLSAVCGSVLSGMRPTLDATLAAAEAELRKRNDTPADAAQADLARVLILRSELAGVERRWTARIEALFAQWPRARSGKPASSSFALISDEELLEQLVGQPAIEALERRLSDLQRMVDDRFDAIASRLTPEADSASPISPRVLVEVFLQTFAGSEVSPALRGVLVRHYGRVASDAIAPVYASINAQLADAVNAQSRRGAPAAASARHPAATVPRPAPASVAPPQIEGWEAVEARPRAPAPPPLLSEEEARGVAAAVAAGSDTDTSAAAFAAPSSASARARRPPTDAAKEQTAAGAGDNASGSEQGDTRQASATLPRRAAPDAARNAAPDAATAHTADASFDAAFQAALAAFEASAVDVDPSAAGASTRANDDQSRGRVRGSLPPEHAVDPGRTTGERDDAGQAPPHTAARARRRQVADASSGLRSDALAARLRALQTAEAGVPTTWRDAEFLSLLALQQADDAAGWLASAGSGEHLRRALARTAATMGLVAEPDPSHLDALASVGAVFDHLAAHHLLSDAARRLLARLLPVYVRLAWSEAALFERDHPALQLLSLLIQCWDANARGSEADAELHAAADAASQALLAADGHGADGPRRALDALRAVVEPLRRRADNAERRAWQSLQGRERLQAARADADRQRARFAALLLLPTVAQCLDDQWRQLLVQTWLRDGPESDAYAAAAALGARLAQLDADAARAAGGAVADALLAIEDALCGCFVACGVDASGAQQLFAQLVAELARPETPRALRDITPLLDPGGAPVLGAAVDGVPEVGRTLVLFAPDQPPQWLRLAWRSPLSGTCLLVTRQGARHAVLDAAQLKAMLADGRLQLRSAEAAVEAALTALL